MAEKTPIAFVTGDAELGAQLYAALRAEFDVAVEYDAFKALDDLESRRPMALIIDENIKPMGGLKFLERAAVRLAKQMVPALLLISKQQETFVQKTAYLGETAYLIKPVDWARLRAKISEAVNAGVEKSWDQLPPVQRSVLSNRVKAW